MTSTTPSLPSGRSVPGTVDPVALLHGHPVFGAFEPAQLKRLLGYARTRNLPAGATLFAKGDPGTAVFAVCRGSIKISVPSVDGREAMFNLLQAGEIFGEIALLDGQPRTADAVAVTDCDLMVIERRDFLTFVQAEPAVTLKLIELLCARLRILSDHFEEVVFLNLPARLARILLQLAQEAGPSARGSTLKITQKELSQMLGSTRESVNKQLRIWAKRKLVALQRGGIAVLAPDALAALAASAGE
jgi:CRP/FNR family transcriptional regulator, cyclic AMP receptor protein